MVFDLSTDVALPYIVLLMVAALVAGTVDAIAGGGGLIAVPCLSLAGLSPHQLLGTNKGQSVFGAAASLVSFWRAGKIDRARALVTFPAGFIGALLGARLVFMVPPRVLEPVVLVLLVVVAFFFAFRRPAIPTEDKSKPVDPHPHHRVLSFAIALVLGGYDGFFGPGTGTFLIFAFALLLRSPLESATADAKVANFGSNLAAVFLFMSKGSIVWAIALPMAAAQLVGGTLGARLAVKGGEKVIRRVVLGVVVALCLKLAYDLLSRNAH